MDRQHPRDPFDVMQLYAHEGITPGIRRAFVAYLACHNRPVHDVLYASPRDIRHDYERNFAGMTAEPIPLEVLLQTRDRMMSDLQSGLGAAERRFPLGLVGGEPMLEGLGIPDLEALPAIRWKRRNLEALRSAQPKKDAAQLAALAGRWNGDLSA